jgi:hypothetical protein
MRLSSGTRLDLMVVQFAASLIQISLENNCDDDGLIERGSNKGYHLNKRIDRRLQKLHSGLQDTVSSLFAEGGKEVALWIRSNLDKRVGKTLLSIQESNVNLESLASWILFINFCERDKPVNKNMVWLQNEKQYFELSDMIGQTEIKGVEADMYQEAYRAISMIKA